MILSHEQRDAVIALARAAAAEILKVYDSEFAIEQKDDRSPLTAADLASHRCIVAGLQALTPHIPVLSEESKDLDIAARREWSKFWLVDPLACAAALASLAIFESDGVLARNRATASRMAELAAPLADLPHVADVRQAGMMLAFELTKDGDKRTPFDPALRVGLRAYRAALERGMVLRPLGDTLYWMPPYCIDDEQLQLLAQVTRDAIIEATACA